jgi:hypothetical protein
MDAGCLAGVPCMGGLSACDATGATFCSPPTSTNVTASIDLLDRVHLAWQVSGPPPEQWVIDRNGLPFATVPGATLALDDLDAGPGTSDSHLVATASLSLGDRVHLAWASDGGAPGQAQSYLVTGMTAGQRSTGVGVSGARRGPQLITFLVTRNASVTFDAGNANAYDDFSASQATITGTAVATLELPRSSVLLTVAPSVGTASVESYVVSATDEVGRTVVASTVSGRRQVDTAGPTRVQWSRTVDGGWEVLPDVTGEAWLDTLAPLDVPVTYRATVLVDGGAGTITSAPVTLPRALHVAPYGVHGVATFSDGTWLDYAWSGATPLLTRATPSLGDDFASGGSGYCGRLADGGATCSFAAPTVPLGSLHAFSNFYNSGTFCALDGMGQPTCWTASGAAVPFAVPTTSLTTLEGHGNFFAGVLPGGAVQSFGLVSTTAALPTTSTYAAVAPGIFGTVGLTSAGSVVSAFSTTTTTPGPFSMVAANDQNALPTWCGALVDGGVRCAGLGSFTNPPPWPASEVGLAGQFAAGVFDGHLRNWGTQAFGVLAIPPVGGFTQVAAGTYASCGMRDGGAVECWGANTLGLVRDGAGAPTGPMNAVTQVVVADTFACGRVLGLSSAACWGNPATQPRLTASDLNIAWTQLAASPHALCGVDTTNQVQCFTTAGRSTGVVNTTQAVRTLTLAEVPDAGQPVFIAYGIATDGGLLELDPLPAAPAPSMGAVVDVSCAPNACCAVDHAGFVHCWSTAGALPNVPTDAGFVAVAVGSSSAAPVKALACALTADGHATCFGNALPPATTVPAPPSPPVAPGRYVGVSGGYPALLLLRDDGHVVGVGYDESGQAPNLSQ